MPVYYVLLGVILILAGISFGTLYWVTLLQRRLHHHAAKLPVATPDASTVPSAGVKAEAHSVMLAEELLKLEQSTHHSFKDALDVATQNLSRDLGETSTRINAQLETEAGKVITQKLSEYQKALEEMRQTAVASLGQIQASIEDKRQILEKDLNADIETQKQQLVAKLDQNLGDVISAYLVEVLGNQVDLGAQSQYLFKTLEANKEELKKEILGGV